MYEKKLTKYRDSLRKTQREQYRVNIRNQLLAQPPFEFTLQNQYQIQNTENTFDNGVSLIGKRDFPELQYEVKQSEISKIFEQLTHAMKSDNLPSSQNYRSVTFFNSLLANFRKISQNRPDHIHSQLMEDCFLFQKIQILQAIQKQQNQQLNESLKSEYLEVYHHLMEALMILISHQIGTKGIFDSSKSQQYWQVRQFFCWLQEVKKSLSDIVYFMKFWEEEKIIRILHKEIDTFQDRLYQLKLIVKILGRYKHQLNQIDCNNLLLEIFDAQFVKDLIIFINNYNSSEKSQAIILSIFDLVEYFNINEFAKFLLKFDFLDYAKFQIVFMEQYKQIRDKRKNTEEEKIKLKIMSDILSIMSQLCDQCSSDIFYSKGLCSEIKSVICEIHSTLIKEDFIKFLLKTVFTISGFTSIHYVSQNNMVEWIVQILDERTQFIKNNKDQIIQYCLESLILVIEVGKFELETDPNLTSNPYLIQLKYLRIDDILNKIEEGQQVLDYFYREELQ